MRVAVKACHGSVLSHLFELLIKRSSVLSEQKPYILQTFLQPLIWFMEKARATNSACEIYIELNRVVEFAGSRCPGFDDLEEGNS